MLRSDEPEARGGTAPQSLCRPEFQGQVPSRSTQLRTPRLPFRGTFRFVVIVTHNLGAAATVLPAGVGGVELGAAADRACLPGPARQPYPGSKATCGCGFNRVAQAPRVQDPKPEPQNVSSWAERPLWTIMLR